MEENENEITAIGATIDAITDGNIDINQPMEFVNHRFELLNLHPLAWAEVRQEELKTPLYHPEYPSYWSYTQLIQVIKDQLANKK